MVQRVADAGAQDPGNPAHEFGAQVPTHAVHSQGQRQPSRLFGPPPAQVFDEGQSLVTPGELPFVDHQACRGPAFRHLVQDPVEGDLAHREGAFGVELSHQPGRRQLSGNGHRACQGLFRRQARAGYEDRPVAMPQAGPTVHQRIAVVQEGVGMGRHGGDFQAPLKGPLVQGLDVCQHMGEAQVAGGNRIHRQGVEHEGVVRVGAVTDADFQGLGHGNSFGWTGQGQAVFGRILVNPTPEGRLPDPARVLPGIAPEPSPAVFPRRRGVP